MHLLNIYFPACWGNCNVGHTENADSVSNLLNVQFLPCHSPIKINWICLTLFALNKTTTLGIFRCLQFDESMINSNNFSTEKQKGIKYHFHCFFCSFLHFLFRSFDISFALLILAGSYLVFPDISTWQQLSNYICQLHSHRMVYARIAWFLKPQKAMDTAHFLF